MREFTFFNFFSSQTIGNIIFLTFHFPLNGNFVHFPFSLPEMTKPFPVQAWVTSWFGYSMTWVSQTVLTTCDSVTSLGSAPAPPSPGTSCRLGSTPQTSLSLCTGEIHVCYEGQILIMGFHQPQKLESHFSSVSEKRNLAHSVLLFHESPGCTYLRGLQMFVLTSFRL